jgi:outer membrane protein assembly factor BamB
MTFTSRLITGAVIAASVSVAAIAQGTAEKTGWSSSNYDQSANRYSPLAQITPANVSTLQRAWSIHLKPAGYSGRLREDEAIPIVIGNTMYVGSPYGAVIAFDATSGRGKMALPASERRHPGQARRRLLARWGWPRRIDRLRVERGPSLLDQGIRRHAEQLVRRQRHRQSQDARGHADGHERALFAAVVANEFTKT